jgi:phosphoribosylformylglycinamidine (FGAM) synthase-like amidotransferase family enzyme
MRKINHSTIVGMMPHPEIYTRPEQNPDYSFSDLNKANENTLKENSIFNLIFKMESK